MNGIAYIYAIENKVNGNCYIGSTIDTKRRFAEHKTLLNHDKHHSFVLQRAWNKYGSTSFYFKVLAICSKKDRVDYENRFMVLQSYNILRTSRESVLRSGRVVTDGTKKKMSESIKKAFQDPIVKARLSASLMGRTMAREAIFKSAKAKWKPVYCRELAVTFLNQKYAAEYLATSKANISQLTDSKGKVHGKYTLVRVV